MIIKGDPPTRYETRATLLSGATRISSASFARAECIMDWTYGIPFGTSGVRAYLRNEYPDFVPTEFGEHRAELIIPELNIHEYRPEEAPGLGWLSHFATRLNLTNVELDVVGCTKAHIRAKLEWFVQYSYGGPEVREFEATIDFTFEGYDERYNRFYYEPKCDQGIAALLGYPGCIIVPKDIEVNADLAPCGWRYYPGGVATTKNIIITPLSTPPVGACDCVGTLASIVSSNSWTNTIRTYEHFTDRRVEVGDGVCICAGTPDTVGLRYHIYRHDIQWDKRTAWMAGRTDDGSLLRSHRIRAARCYQTYPAPPYNTVMTTIDPDAGEIADYEATAFLLKTSEECTENVRGSPCPITIENPDGSPPDIEDCFTPAKSACEYEGYVMVSHDPQICQGRDVENLTTRKNNLLKAEVASDGNIIVYRSEMGDPPYSSSVKITTTGNCVEPRLAEDYIDRIWCVFHTDNGLGAIASYYCQSNDDGKSFSTPSAMPGIANGKHMKAASSGAPHGSEGDIAIAAMVPDSNPGPGVIKCETMLSGDLTFRTPVTFQYWNGSALANLRVEDSQFGFTREQAGPRRWILSVIIEGETSSSDWWSAEDEPKTFTRFA